MRTKRTRGCCYSDARVPGLPHVQDVSEIVEKKSVSIDYESEQGVLPFIQCCRGIEPCWYRVMLGSKTIETGLKRLGQSETGLC